MTGAATGRHLLALPAGSAHDDVVALVVTRRPHATREGPGRLRLSRHSLLLGPLADASVDGLGPGHIVYALDAPVEREPPIPFPVPDPDGMLRAFPGGLPTRDEGRQLDLIRSIARRMGGAVRVAGTGRVLRPDPDTAIDLIVHSPYWLTPETLLPVVRRTLTHAELAVAGTTWDGPSDAFDAAALARPDELDGYAISALLDARLGRITVGVQAEELVNPALAGLDWPQRGVASYAVRWVADDPADRRPERPGAEFRQLRARIRWLVGRVARTVVEAASGVVLDEDGFYVDRYTL